MHKILFLEDDASLATNYINALQQQGFQVLHLPDAAIAVELVLGSTFDAMVVDLQLPIPRDVTAHEVANGDKTGLWFLDKVRNRMLTSNLPAFVLTNNLARHLHWLERFAQQVPALPRYLLERRSKINCGAKQLPLQLRTQIELAKDRLHGP